MNQKDKKNSKQDLKVKLEPKDCQSTEKKNINQVNDKDDNLQNKNFIFYCINMITLLDIENYFKEEDKEGNEYNILLSCHIEKRKQNEIYYYKYTNITKTNEDIKDNIFYFKCCDNKCKGLSTLYLNEANNSHNIEIFRSVFDHSVKYEEHSYVIFPSKGNKYYNKIMQDNKMLNHLQLLKFSKYFINTVYFDHFLKEQYKYDIKHSVNKKNNKKKSVNKPSNDNINNNSGNNNNIQKNNSKIHNTETNGKEKEKELENKKKSEIIEIIDEDN